MFSELLNHDEIERIEQDRTFYQIQQKLQRAKLAAGIPFREFEYDTQFNFIKRIDWLKKVEANIQARLNQSYEKQTSITSNTPDFEETKKLIYKEENARKELRIFLAEIKAKISQIVSSRKGLPLLAIHWHNYTAKITRSDYELYFLSPSFQQYCEFIRPEFDESDFAIIHDIYNSFLSPTDLILAFAEFLGVGPDTVIIACSNQRFNGFELWTTNNSSNYDNFITERYLELISFDNAFVLKYENDDIDGFVKTDTFKNINVWIDPLTLEIFVNKSIMPLKINRTVNFPHLFNVEYMPLVAFDYTNTPHIIEMNDIIQEIQTQLPTAIIRDIFAFNGRRFELIPSGKQNIWTYANLMVFSLNEDTTDARYAFIYNLEKRVLTKFVYQHTFNFDDLIRMVSETLEYLKISGFEQHCPDKIIEKYDNGESE